MVRLRIHAAIAAVLLLGCAALLQAQTWPAPVNPHASPEARALLQLIDSISGKYTLTGQHNFPNDGSRWTDRVYDLTAKYPALFGEDFGFSAGEDKDSAESRPAMIEEVKRQYANGAVIALCWHEVKPTEDEPVTFRDSVQGHLTDFEWNELLTPGTALNLRWQAQVDVIAGFLAQLRDAHVPVLFRPYHEINGNFFWWNGRPGPNGSAGLYRQLYDRFVNRYHLDNLVWVWNLNAPNGSADSIGDYYPGPQFADILTIDIYGEFKQDYYTAMLKLAAGKPIALGEVGAIPSLDVLTAQPRWAYFMVWSGGRIGAPNTVDFLNTIYHAPNLLTRDSPQLAEPMAAMRKLTALGTAGKPDAEPATMNATPEAQALLSRLYEVSGKSTLSGQQNTPQFVSAATQAITALTSKRPAIYGEELGVTSEMGVESAAARKAIVEEAKHQHGDGAIVSLTWHPTRPTDEEPASDARSVRGQLTDFEWNELMTPGTTLNRHWTAQVDEVAKTLKQLQDAGIAILWQPYPGANGKTFWWAGRKGIHGSAQLYRMLFDRLVNQDGVHNLVWVWDAAPPGFGPNAAGGPLSDYFPGLLYVDALAIDVEGLGSRFRTDAILGSIALGKPIGLGLTGKVPAPEILTQQPYWAWFLVSATAASAANQAAALGALYATPRVLDLPIATPSH